MKTIKGILLSIQSQHLVKILNGEKTQELRKSIPKGFVGWVYLYCTKALPRLFNRNSYFVLSKFKDKHKNDLNGKVAARFWFDGFTIFDSTKGNPKIYISACVDDKDVPRLFNNKMGFAWHIKHLEIFYKPKELKDFHIYNKKQEDNIGFQITGDKGCEYLHTLTRAPQSWQYVYTKEEEY